MNNLFDLKGKTAIVTGAGSGIGQAIACGLASAGAAVVIAGRSRETLGETADRITELGGQVLVVPTDVTKTGELNRLVKEAAKFKGSLDILVNNAGINKRYPALEYSEADWNEIIAVNLSAPFRLSQTAARLMIDRKKGGSIINIGSLTCEVARPTIPAYTAAKGGIRQLTKALAVEWAGHGIRVNAIGPGYIHTPLTETLTRDRNFNDWIMLRTPMKRWGRPEDLIGAAIFLASDASAFMTGQVMYVDGGLLVNL